MATTITITICLPDESGDQWQHILFDHKENEAIKKVQQLVTAIPTGMKHGVVAASIGLADSATVTAASTITAGDTLVVNGTSLTASASVNTGTNFLVGQSADLDISNLIDCVNRNCQLGAVAVRSSSGVAKLYAVEAGSAAPPVSLTETGSSMVIAGTSGGNLSGGSAVLDTASVRR